MSKMHLATTLDQDRVAVRLATDSDDAGLRRLAALDSAAPLTRPVLLGELDGMLVAATSLRDGREVADPFVLTSDVAAMLRVRASQLNGRRSSRMARRLRSRLAWSS
jgi:hypothetical protein